MLIFNYSLTYKDGNFIQFNLIPYALYAYGCVNTILYSFKTLYIF